MSEPWFNPNVYAWIPGTALGVLGGVWGSLVGILAPRGKGKRLVVGLAWLLFLGSAALLGAAATGLVTGQPYGVWYGLGLPGAIGVVVIGVNMMVMDWVYRAAEARKMAARDLAEPAGAHTGDPLRAAD
jgi:hypothetical protein